MHTSYLPTCQRSHLIEAIQMQISSDIRPQPGDLVMPLGEPVEKILKPYPRRQPARSLKFTFSMMAAVGCGLYLTMN